MLSDLTVGDKLSLKGKIFELSKKLKLIEVEKQQQEALVFQPQLNTTRHRASDGHVHPTDTYRDRSGTGTTGTRADRDSWAGNLERQQVLRKQRMEMIRASVDVEEACSFSPVISRKAQHLNAKWAAAALNNQSISQNHGHSHSHRQGDNGAATSQATTTARSNNPFTPKYTSPSSTSSTQGRLAHPHSERSEKTSKSSLEGTGTLLPAHERLYSKGLEYRVKAKQRESLSTHQDADGVVLFQPALHRPPKTVVNGKSRGDQSADLTVVGADEYLYRDARDREERMRQRRTAAKIAADEAVKHSKINQRSELILRRKHEKDVRAVFHALDTADNGFLGYDDVQAALEEMAGAGVGKQEDVYRRAEAVWGSLDVSKRGSVSLLEFLRLSGVGATSSATDGVSDPIASSKPLFDFLRDMLAFLRMSFAAVTSSASRASAAAAVEAAAVASGTFRPMINDRSRRLASRKELSDIKAIAAVKMQHRRVSRGAPVSISDTPVSVSVSVDVDVDVDVPDATASEDNTATDAPFAIDASMSKSDLLYARQILKDRRLAEEKRRVDANLMRECSFQPTIYRQAYRPAAPTVLNAPKNTVKARNPGSTDSVVEILSDNENENENYNDKEGGQSTSEVVPESVASVELSVHERLYALSKKVTNVPRSNTHSPVSVGGSHKSVALPWELAELEKCTFEPHASAASLASLATMRSELEAPKKPFDGRVSRDIAAAAEKMRKARETRQLKAREVDDKMAFNEARYQRNRERLLAEGPVAPVFSSDRRLAEKIKKHRPKLIVDVKLGAVRTAQLLVDDGDDPFELTNNFCRLYGIHGNARVVLEEVVRQSMADNGLVTAASLQDGSGGGSDNIDSDSEIDKGSGSESDNRSEYGISEDSDGDDNADKLLRRFTEEAHHSSGMSPVSSHYGMGGLGGMGHVVFVDEPSEKAIDEVSEPEGEAEASPKTEMTAVIRRQSRTPSEESASLHSQSQVTFSSPPPQPGWQDGSSAVDDRVAALFARTSSSANSHNNTNNPPSPPPPPPPL